jgi:phage gp16-like protein
MIVDLETFKALGRGSTKRVLCRCDDCGRDSQVIRYKLTQRGGYVTCQPCAVRRTAAAFIGRKRSVEFKAKVSASGKGTRRRNLSNEERASRKGRKYVVTTCTGCGVEGLRRSDQILGWTGRCRSCNSKRNATLPGAKERMREIGRALMARIGPLPHPPEKVLRGERHYNWKGGITPENAKIRSSVEMAAWRRAVWQRDDYTCQMCGSRGGDKHADHIRPFALHPELRFDLDNGRTLCVPCHHKYGAKVFRGKLIREAEMTR